MLKGRGLTTFIDMFAYIWRILTVTFDCVIYSAICSRLVLVCFSPASTVHPKDMRKQCIEGGGRCFSPACSISLTKFARMSGAEDNSLVLHALFTHMMCGSRAQVL